jgi:hypothetical protein
MNEVFFTDEFGEWIDSLDASEAEDVLFVVDLLADAGLKLGVPHSSALRGSEKRFRELRPRCGASSLRVVYAYDPRRDAVLLIGGDKGNDKRFYERILRRAEPIWERYLEEQAAGLHDKETR